uniref:Uncharacterized protein n=1 Tax=Arundo donax TaxID=35708 RepID=A0A0A9AEB6_ARUDO
MHQNCLSSRYFFFVLALVA